MKKNLLTTFLLSIFMVLGVGSAWAQSPYFSQNYEGSGVTADWISSNTGRYTVDMNTVEDNTFLTVNAVGNGNNGTDITSTSLVDKVATDADFTLEFDLQITNGNNQASSFYIYDSANAEAKPFFSLVAPSAGGTTWNLQGSSDNQVTLAKTTWFSFKIAKVGAITYLTLKNKATGDVIKDKAVIPTLSEAGGLGKMVFHTKRYYAYLAIDNVVLRDVEEGDAPASVPTTYTIKYQDANGTTLKDDVVVNSIVGLDVTASSDQAADFKVGEGETLKKWIYVSGNNAITTVEDGASNIITLIYREASIFNYTFTAKAGETLLETYASATGFENDKIAVPYHHYYNVEGTIYQKGATSSEYNYPFVLDADNKAVGISDYAATDKTNVIYFSEAEDIPTISHITDGLQASRNSFAGGGYATEEIKLLYLNAGTYKLTAAAYGGAYTFKYGESTILDMEQAGYWRELSSEEFTLTETTPIIFKGGNGATGALDYIIIQSENGSIGEAPTKSIFLKPGLWNVDGARYAAYAFTAASNKWFDFAVAEEEGVYTVDIPESYTGLILVRMNGETAENNWDNKWNQSADINFAEVADSTLFTITDWSAYEASKYEKAEPVLNTYTATFTTNAGWEKVYAYAWTGETKFLGDWPGTELTATDGVYNVTIEAETAPEFIIFNNGNGAQTANLVFENGKAYDFNVEDSELMAEAKALAADAEAVAVGKLTAAIAAAQSTGDESNLQAAIDQFKADNAETGLDVTEKVGKAKESWTVGTGNNSNRGTYDKNGITLVEHYGETAVGVMISQEVEVENGLYNIELYATSHNAWNNYGASLQEDANDVAYVFGTSGENTVKTWITARRNSGMLDIEPEKYAVNGVEVANGKLTMGLALDKADQTEWHTIQIASLKKITTAKAAYAAVKANMTAEIAAAKALTGEIGKEALNDAITTAEAALTSNMLNVTEFEVEVNKLQAAVVDFKKANAIIPEGTYYVLNAAFEEESYIAAGKNWGTRGIVNGEGLDLKFIYDVEKGTYTIDTNVDNNNNRHFLGSNLYLDSPVFEWTIEGEFVYTISAMVDGVKKYIGVDTDGNLALKTEATDDTQWAFIYADYLKNVRLEGLKAATAENGVDATFLLQNPNFNNHDKRVSAWSISEDCTNKNLSGGANETHFNACAESFHSTFTISQAIKGAPAGVYKMTAQGFFRQDKNANDVDTVETAPVFFIGDQTAEVPAKTGTEDNMIQASESFTAGQYTIEPIEFVYSGEGDLVVGIKNETAKYQWIIFDNFQLTYYGSVPATTYTVTVAETQNGTVEVGKTAAAEGENVTVTVTPAEGYMVDEAYWTYGEGENVTKTNIEEPAEGNAASFTMPAANVTVTVTFKAIPVLNTYTATFTTDYDWAEVYAYVWSGEGEDKILGDWPGTKLTANEGVYTVTINAETAPEKIIFNNGNNKQTEDLDFVNGKAYEYMKAIEPEPGKTELYYWVDGLSQANSIKLAEGVTLAITGNTDKKWSSASSITVDGKQYTSIKLSNGAQNTLTLDKDAVGITFYSYVNKDAATERAPYWKEVAGVNYTEETSGGTMTSYKDGANPDKRTFKFDKTKTITFTNTGEQLCFVFEVEYAPESTEPEKIESMYLMGELTGGWDFTDTQKMTQDAENPAVWTLTVENFEAEANTYKYKATANGKWGVYELPASGDNTFTFGTEEYPAGKYNLLFTVNTTDGTLTLAATKVVDTGISMLKAAIENGAVYNMNGQKVSKAQKGLYIINGKKTVVIRK